MARLTNRDNWRVAVTGTLDLTVPGGPRIEVRVKDAVIEPQPLGDFGWVKIPNSWASSDIQGDYEERCKEIVSAVRARFPGVRAETLFDVTETCSLCNLVWDVWTAEAAERWPDDDAPVGLPLCCDEAQAEWCAAQGVTA